MSLQVQTVVGPVDVRKLGRTLTHEHLSACVEHVFYTPPPDHIKNLPVDILKQDELSLENYGIVRQYPYSNRQNIIFNDPATHEAVLWEMELFRASGGGTIVENTSHGLKRDLGLMVQASRQTGINIIAGTGFYVHQSQSASLLSSSTEALAEIIRTDLTQGCSEMAEVKCGVIAEVGSGWPINDFERRAIQATALVQSEVGCGVSFHPGRNSDAPSEIARIYLEAGGDKNKAVMSHLDRTICEKDKLLDFAETSGFYCQFDLFGLETSLYQFSLKTSMLSDAQRIERIRWLMEDGKTNKILMSHDVGTKHRLFDLFGLEASLYQLDAKTAMPSDAQRIDRIIWLLQDNKDDKILTAHDIHTKHRLVKFGGHGFSHLLLTVSPQMLNKGISQGQIDQIMINNPAKWLAVPSNYQPTITLG